MRLLAPAVLVLAAGVGPAGADELQLDRVYAGGTRVESPAAGLSFVTPHGWVGRFGQDARHQVLILGSNTVEGVGLAIIQSGVSAQQVLRSLDEPQDLGAGVVLRPVGAPSVIGPRIAARYRDETYVGRALAVIGPARNGVVFFFAGPARHEAVYAALLEGLAGSTGFAQPVAAPAPAPAPASGRLGEAWSELLTGQALHYFSSYNSGGGGGGMASHRVLHLCAGGRFRYAGDSLVTMNVPGAGGSAGGRDGFQGRWRLESPGESAAVLVLVVDGGQELRWQVRYDGQKTFLNGQRWLRERSKVCG